MRQYLRAVSYTHLDVYKRQILLRAGRNILRGQVFDENFLMSLATLGAFAIGEYPEAVAVTVSYTHLDVYKRQGLDKIASGWFDTTWPMIGGTAAGVDAEATASIMSLVSSHTPNWYAWIVDTIIVPNAFLFQKLIVIVEVGLGLAFISGTFTFLAAIISIGMNINFLLSTGLNDLWFLAASFPMLGGAGRTFGLDHYLLPFLNRWAQKFNRKG